MAINKDALPTVLYHGSMFKQQQLMPGYNHSRKLVQWDETESNAFLYATSVEETAIELGFASAIEKLFGVIRFSLREGNKVTIETDRALDLGRLQDTPVYLYKFACKDSDGWVRNNNQHNGLNTEFKTTQSIREIRSCERVDIKAWLSKHQVTINKPNSKVNVGLEAFKPRTIFSW